MNNFYVWETVTFRIVLTSDDEERILDGVKDVIVTLKQSTAKGLATVEKSSAAGDITLEPDENAINIYLSQEETGQFRPRAEVPIQVNILYNNTERDTSAQGALMALENLHAEVME